ncbi:MAG TPA: signal peptidase I [Ilumatobacter sp.]|nr:signal peptidase I [Ilumatobacter sp.]
MTETTDTEFDELPAEPATPDDDDVVVPPVRPAGGLTPGARAFFDWVIVVGVALLVAIIVRTFLLAHYQVEGTSMLSTLNEGDRVFVNKMSYRLHDPNRGDVVVLHELTGTIERDLIKRVIALPEETIEIVDCNVYIDGLRLDEPYLDPAVVADRTWCEMAPVTVPEDRVFVMGDNRPSSSDSRSFGPIDEINLVGRAFVVFWPRGDWQWL